MLHTELPIYKVAYNLFDLGTSLAKNMPRDLKQLIGGEIVRDCVRITILIFRANCAQDKTPYLTELIERKETVELMLRLSRDKHLISTKQYAQAIALTSNVGRQAHGWKRPRSATRPLQDGQGRHD